MDDSELIRDYADTGSETAFTTLVQRHVGLVYSTALRQLSDAHAAQEVSQAVFCLFANKARTLGPKTSLTGWLYRTTCFKASEYRRTTQRRFVREQEAARMNSSINALGAESDANWNQFAPLLDDAMQELSEADRLAILLRYFQNQPLREVGVALGLEEDAARKRVSRALDKLRDWFSAKGVVSTSIGLAGILSTNAVQAVPFGIADALVKSSLVTSPVAAGSATLSTTTYMASIKAVLATAAIVATALTIPLLSQRRENQELQRQVQNTSDELSRLKAQNASLASLQISADELARLRANQMELLRLRGEVGRLKRDLQAKPASSSNETTTAAIAEINPDMFDGRSTGAVNARVPLGQTFMTGGSEGSPGKRVLAFITPSAGSQIGTPDQITFETVFVEATDDQLQHLSFDVEKLFGEIKSESIFNERPTKDQLAMTKALLTKEQFAVVRTFCEQQAGTDVLTAPKMTTLNERQGRLMSWGDDGRDPPPMVIDVMPRLTTGRDAVDLTVSMNLRQSEPGLKNQSTNLQ